MIDTGPTRRCRACKGTGHRPATAACAACGGQGRVLRGKRVPRAYSPELRRWLAAGHRARHNRRTYAGRLGRARRRGQWKAATERQDPAAVRLYRLIKRVTGHG